jgi:Zn-dependent protease with chaperone function
MQPDLPPLGPVHGFVYGAGASARAPAALWLLAGNWLELRSPDGTVLARLPLSAAQIDPPLGRAPRRITLPDGALFETSDHSGITAITGQTRGALLHRYEAFGPRLIAVALACLGGAFLLWRYGLDILVAIAIWATPPAVVAQMDSATLQVLDFQLAEPTNLPAPDQARIRVIFANLQAALPKDTAARQSLTLLFRDVPGLGPNAFALPGGTVVMTDAFVQEFPEDDILAGVLGHEIGHVIDQHGLKRLYRSVGTAVLIAFLAGDVGPILEDIVLEGNLLLSLSHSRAQERLADDFGLRLTAAAGYDPRGLAQFFDRIAQDYGADEGADWLSTHPSSAQRLQEINRLIETLPAP